MADAMTPSPHAALIARLTALHNDTDNWLCADVAEHDVAIRLIARCHDALTDCLAALADAVPPATPSDWEAAEHTAGTYTGPVQAINVPPATARETEHDKFCMCQPCAVTRGLGFIAEFKGDGRCALNCFYSEALAAEIYRLRAALPAPAPQGETALCARVKEWHEAATDYATADSTVRGVSIEQASRLYRAEANLHNAALSASPPPLPEAGVPGSEVLCEECAKAFCPHAERLHFHHDGCPACEAEDAEDIADARAAEARYTARGVEGLRSADIPSSTETLSDCGGYGAAPSLPPLSEPVWDIQQMCDGCKTTVHCAHHRRCLAECVPADLVQSLHRPPDAPGGET